jgi:hypothetical protein
MGLDVEWDLVGWSLAAFAGRPVLVARAGLTR